MRAVICPRYGPPDVLEVRDVPTPEPGHGEVLVRVRAAGLNAADWHILRADPFVVRLSLGPVRPRIAALGADVAGTVEALGPGTSRFAPGDAVFADLSSCGFGAFADVARVPERLLARMPATAGFDEAAALPLAGGTALQALRDQAGVQPGERVLVHGASGGVGGFAVQIAKALGARVTAVCSAGKAEQARALGADEVVDYAEHDVTSGGRQWDVILGVNGFQPISRYKACLSPGGRYVGIGGTGRQMLQAITLGRLLSSGGRRLGMLRAVPTAEKLEVLAGMWDGGALTTVIDRRFPLEGVVPAMRHLEGGHSHGKTVLLVAPPADESGGRHASTRSDRHTPT